MDALKIIGGVKLTGKINISGAKNAALPLICASLLTDETLTLSNLPRLADITTLSKLMIQHGVDIKINDEISNGNNNNNGNILTLRAKQITSTTAPYDLVRLMRASILVLGPLLARCGEATVSLPGGCAIGARPVDLHLKGLQQLGAEIKLEKGYIIAKAPKGLIGAEITFPFISVGATENLMMAASLSRGTTKLINAAREPEVIDLADCLIAMGAKIKGAGSDTIIIDGVSSLHGAKHNVIADRVEAGSLIMAVAVTKGNVELIGAMPRHLDASIDILKNAGVVINKTKDGMQVSCDGLVGCDVMTEPYPGFPTDLQAQIMAMMAVSDGASMITESIFENRFMHVPELIRMGANINLHGRSAMVRGVQQLTGAEVMATDLRASMSLIIAALAANGKSIINRVYHLDRGYQRLEEKLAACGANIERIKLP